MTSNDTDSITIQLRELISINKEQIAEMKTLAAQIQRDNAEFHALMIKEFSDFTKKQEERFEAFASNIEAKFEAFTNKIETKFEASSLKSETRFDRLETQIAVMQNDITGIKHDVASLFHWDYWILTFIAAALVVPHLPDIIKSLVGAVIQSISAVASLFSKKKNYDA